MKITLVLLLGFLCLPAVRGWAQTADEWIARGRSNLVVRNLTNAHTCFAAAVSAAPTHETANALVAATRLLSLPLRPAASAFLDRLGVSAAGRSIYDWRTTVPEDTNGVPLAPAGIGGRDGTEFLRTNLLPEVAASLENLGRVTSPGFLLGLSSNETALAEVTLDRGDVLLLRSLLHGFEYLGHTIGSWDANVVLTTLRALHEADLLTIQRVLADHPQLLRYAATDELPLARQAFLNAVALYLQASDVIRARPADVTRLFNYDSEMAEDEADFRQLLAELRDSLERPVTLTVATNYTVHLARLFDGANPPRPFLPAFTNDAFIEGTLPDPTFGRTVTGLLRADVEEFLVDNVGLEIKRPDVRFFAVVKGQEYGQAGDAAPVPASVNPFLFSAVVEMTSSNAVSSATLRLPAGTPIELPRQPTRFVLTGLYATQAALDAAYPNGTYVMTLEATHDGRKTVPFDLVGDAYPATPRVSNLAAAQTIESRQDFTLRWDPLPPAAATDFIQVTIQDLSGREVWTSPRAWAENPLPGTASSVVIPAETLAPGQTYRARLLVSHAITRDRTSFIAGVGVSSYYKATRFEVRTLFDPDVRFFAVVKQQGPFRQTGDAEPVLNSDRPFRFSASVDNTGPWTVTGGSLRMPGGPTRPLGLDRDGGYLEGAFGQLADLNTAYPDGPYTFTFECAHDGTQTSTLSLAGAAYPSTPRLSDWPALQAIDVTRPCTVNWDAFAGGGPEDFIAFRLADEDGELVYGTPDYGEAGALTGTAAGLVIPRDRLAPFQTYRGELQFARRSAVDTASVRGALGVAGYLKTTEFEVRTLLGGVLPDLPFCRPLRVATDPGSPVYYQLEVPAVPTLFLTFQTRENTLDHTLRVWQDGRLVASSSRVGDSLLEIRAPAPGRYVVGVGIPQGGEGVLRACADLPAVELKALFVGTIQHNDGEDWAQLEVPAGVGALEFIVETPGNISQLEVWRDQIGSPWSWSGSQSFDPPIQLIIPSPAPGRYYLRVTDHGRLSRSQVRDYSIFAHALEPEVVIDNDVVRAVIDPNRACVTSLRFKPGTNTELVWGASGVGLLDPGGEAEDQRRFLGQGWQLLEQVVEANHVVLDLRHRAGFANRLTLDWDASHVTVRCDLVAPTEIALPNHVPPGAGFVAGADRWAVPTVTGVQTGSFDYPGFAWETHWPPQSEGAWGKPAEPWLAFWNDTVDEVHGFTWSGPFGSWGDYGVRVASLYATDLRFLVPVGPSQIAFHVTRPKPAAPHEALRAVSRGPALALETTVDHRIAMPGTELAYRLRVANMSEVSALDVTLIDTLPAVGLEVVPGSISHGGTFDASTRRIAWRVGKLEARTMAEARTFRATVGASVATGTRLINLAQASTSGPWAASPSGTLTVVGGPQLSGSSPTSAGNRGPVTLELRGERLDPLATVRLVRAAHPDRPASRVEATPDGVALTATFDLTNADPGPWTIEVRNPGGGSSALDAALEIKPGGAPKLWIDVVGRSQIRAGRQASYEVRYGNAGDVDAVGVVASLEFPPFFEPVAPAHDAVVLPAESPGTELWFENALPPGTTKTRAVSFRVLPTVASGTAVRLDGFLGIPGAEIKDGFCPTESYPIPGVSAPDVGDNGGWEGPPITTFTETRLWIERRPLKPEVQRLNDRDCSVTFRCREWVNHQERKCHMVYHPILGQWVSKTCDDWFTVRSEGNLTERRVTLDCDQACPLNPEACEEQDSEEGTVTAPEDPNEKVVSSGYDPAGTTPAQRRRFVADDASLGYMVFFENRPTASAAVQDMAITDRLSANLDFGTFAFNAIQLGARRIEAPAGALRFSTQIDLRPDLPTIVNVEATFEARTGVVTWYFRGTDPYTGLLADFLPPNTDAVAPRGEGWVSYTVKPRAGLPTGTVIRNRATIDFEVDVPPAPLDTPEVFNTLDAAAPESRVLALPSTVDVLPFPVAWVGQDDAGGSGVQSYDLFVRDADGPWTRWLDATPSTSALFPGEVGHTYAFYSVARDGVGHREPPPATPDATTLVVGGGAPRLAARLSVQGIVIAWPKAVTGFQLEASPTVGPGAVWQPVSGTPSVAGAEQVVVVAPSAAARFYRLKR